MSKEKYTLEVSLYTIEHLGINLYSSTPAVLSEVIANAYDADATTVNILKESNTITITDNGIGMNDTDINEKYLTVGYKRREIEDTATSPKGRKVMGRKGVGKLSLFAIAHTITIITKKTKEKPLGFVLKLEDIQKCAKNKASYHPKELSIDEISSYLDNIKDSGTIIILNNLQKKRTIDKQIKQSIARRFACIEEDFAITYNKEDITYEDRNYFKELEFYWIINEQEIPKGIRQQIPQKTFNSTDEKIHWSGWIGSFKKHNRDDNKIALIVRKKIAIENILDFLDINYIGADYLIGEIYADYLDDDVDYDRATTSRQGIIEDDENFKEIKEQLKKIVTNITTEWVSQRRKKGAENIFSLLPPVKEWHENLKSKDQTYAKKLLGIIHTFRINDEEKKDLVKSVVLAVEKNKILNILDNVWDNFDTLTPEKIQAIGGMFTQHNEWEAATYYEITQERLKIIDKLKDITNDNELEKVIQTLIFENLWLLDPGWERPTENEEMEQALEKNESFLLTDEEMKGRIDIKYKVSGAEHVIVELKRPNISYNHYEILKQIDKYRHNIKEQLHIRKKDNESIKTVVLIGDKAYSKHTEKKEYIKDMKERKTIVQSYSFIINNSRERYKEYLNSKKYKVTPIIELIEKIESCDISPKASKK